MTWHRREAAIVHDGDLTWVLTLDAARPIGLTHTASSIWSAADGCTDHAMLMTRLTAIIDGPLDDVAVAAFVTQLVDARLLEVGL